MKAKSFVMIMIIIALASLVLRIAIEQVIKLSMAQNESYAQATLKLISAALENYAKDNKGVYPANISPLTKNSPGYLDKDYLQSSPLRGYIYSCPRLEASGYSCYAQPAKCKLTGKINYSITTGSLFVSEECNKKE